MIPPANPGAGTWTATPHINAFPDEAWQAGMVVTQVFVEELYAVVAVAHEGENVICEFGTLQL
ncbi:MAG: hypothetical protein JO170_30770 [Verrucomicrobia bacterium]|nr:hypothetical protein [Verrucomicrobiota bacterium]